MLNDLDSLPRECAICGTTEDLTKEHVLPKALEGEDTKDWMPVLVWLCRKHNHDKSKLDGNIRDFLALDMFADNNETAENLRSGRIRRSIERLVNKGGRSELLETLKAMQPMEVVSGTGEVIGKGMGIVLPKNTFVEWLEYVIRGLSMALSDKRFSDEADFDVRRYYPDAIPAILQRLKELDAPEPAAIGSHTKFTYVSFSGLPTGFGLWVFVFYDGVIYDVLVSPPDQSEVGES